MKLVNFRVKTIDLHLKLFRPFCCLFLLLFFFSKCFPLFLLLLEKFFLIFVETLPHQFFCILIAIQLVQYHHCPKIISFAYFCKCSVILFLFYCKFCLFFLLFFIIHFILVNLLRIPQIPLLLFLIRKSQCFFPRRVIVNRRAQYRQIRFFCQLFRHQNLRHIRRGILRIHIQHFVNIFACLFKILIFQIQIHALHQIVCFAALLHFLHHSFLHYRVGRTACRTALPAQLLHAAHKVLHPAQLRHVLRLQASKFLGHVIRIQPLEARNQHLPLVRLHHAEEAAPLVLHPNRIIVFVRRPERQHHLRGGQRRVDVRLVLRA